MRGIEDGVRLREVLKVRWQRSGVVASSAWDAWQNILGLNLIQPDAYLVGTGATHSPMAAPALLILHIKFLPFIHLYSVHVTNMLRILCLTAL